MTFAGEIREELIKHYDKAGNCRRAELAAIMMISPGNVTADKAAGIYIYSKKNASGGDDGGEEGERKTYAAGDDMPAMPTPDFIEAVTTGTAGKRAFLRGAFIASGTISDPQKDYHLEISVPDAQAAELMCGIMKCFDINGKITERRGRYAVYLKDGEEISQMLNVMGAHISMMKLENIRIEKSMRSSVNRRINCDTANINKTVAASLKQIEDIELVVGDVGMENLEPRLQDICRVRIENPDATLEELGELLTPPVGKSGVNHRLRKISAMADNIRKR